MSAYNRGELSVDAYMVRLLAAIVRQNGGELRVKGELVDAIGEPTALIKEWDSSKQEVVLRSGMGSFVEVYKVVPEKQSGREVFTARPAQPVDPLDRAFFREPEPRPETPSPRSNVNPLDDTRASALEKKRNAARAAAVLRQYLDERKRNPEQANA